ncbi:hypothetical protein DVA69_17500, partial [Acinetobacter baumannii]
ATAFTLNRTPSKSVETTPFELWFGKKPKLSYLKVWGCDAYVKKLQPDKLEPKSEKCVFIGYPKETVGYTFYHRSEGKTFVAKNGSSLRPRSFPLAMVVASPMHRGPGPLPKY